MCVFVCLFVRSVCSTYDDGEKGEEEEDRALDWFAFNFAALLCFSGLRVHINSTILTAWVN